MAVDVKIQKNFGAFQLDVQFQSRSRRIGILGGSGCGKSLTLKSIAGIETPNQGKIVINGRVMFDSKEKKNLSPQERRIGYLFQDYALFPTMTVEKNIGIGLKCGKEEKKGKVQEMIKRFRLEGLEHRLPGELSGGQKQRTALARIMIYEPDMILLDEPFSALDVYLKDKMQRECMEFLKDYSGTVILVSHSRDEIYRFSEEALVMADGSLVVQKPTKDLFDHPEKIEAAKLTGCKNIAELERVNGKCRIPKWGVDIQMPEVKEGKGVCAVGIRAHEFELEKPEGAFLVFPVLDPKITEDMFEYTISFFASKTGTERIDWKISKYQWNLKENVLPQEIYLRKNKLLLLR